MLVGVIAPLAVDEMVGLLEWPTIGVADLVVIDSGGSGHGCHRRDRRSTTASHVIRPGPRSGSGGRCADPDPERAVATWGSQRGRSRSDRRNVGSRSPGNSLTRARPGRRDGLFRRWWRDASPRCVLLALLLGQTCAESWRINSDSGASDPFRRRRPDPEWSLVVDGFDGTHERVHEALMTLADGHLGTSGASLVPHPSQHPWVVAAGVYDGDGADSHLLTGPRVFELAGIANGAPLRRVLDLRTGVLYERTVSDGASFDSVRFASLAEPSTSVLRVRCPKGQRSGPPADATDRRLRPRQGSLWCGHLDPGRRLPWRDRGRRLADPHHEVARSTGSPSTGLTPITSPTPAQRSTPSAPPAPPASITSSNDIVGHGLGAGRRSMWWSRATTSCSWPSASRCST